MTLSRGESMNISEYADAKLNGMSDAEIANAVNVTESELESMKKKWGVAKEERSEKVELTKNIYEEERKNGLSNEKIATKYKISVQTLYNRKKKWDKERDNKDISGTLQKDISDTEKDLQEKLREAEEAETLLEDKLKEWEEKNAELQRLLDEEKKKREAAQQMYWEEKEKRVRFQTDRDDYKAAADELDEVLGQTKEELVQERIARQALEEKLEHYENGGDSKSITYFMNENEKLRNIIRAQAEVI